MICRTACCVVCLICGLESLFAQSGSPIDLFAGRGSVDGDWDGDGLADHWEAKYDASVFIPSVTSLSPAEGKRCQKIAFQKLTGGAATMSISSGISVGTSPLKPGTILQVSFRWRTSATVTNTQWKVWGNWADASGGGDVALSGQNWLPAQTAWQTWSGTMYVPSNAYSIVIGIYLSSQPGACAGELYVDDVQVRDGQVFPTRPVKALKTLLSYQPYANWLDTGNLFDGCFFHAWYDREAVEKSFPTFNSNQWVGIAYVTNSYTVAPENPFEYGWILLNHPDWFLRDYTGNIISAKGQSSLDLGNASYQQALLQQLMDMASRENWKGLFLDYLDVHARDNTLDGRQPANYSSDAQWQAACTAMLQALQPLRQMGIKLIANVAHAPSYTEPGATWLSLLDGWQIEYGYVLQDRTTTDMLWSPWSSWLWKFRTESENPTKTIILGHRLPEQYKNARRFAMASFLAGMADLSYFGYCASELENAYSVDFEAPLGPPLASYVVESGNMTTGALISRKFTNGMVLVNPTDSTVYSYMAMGWHQDLDGNYVPPGPLILTPKTGLMLLDSAAGPMTLTGVITLAGYLGSAGTVPIGIDILDPGTQAVRQSFTVGAGLYTIAPSVPPGVYDVRFKGVHRFLAKRLTNVSLANGANMRSLSLTNGDVDGNNSIDGLDINILLVEYTKVGSYPTSLGYSDLNGDGKTDLLDLNLAISGYQFIGDS